MFIYLYIYDACDMLAAGEDTSGPGLHVGRRGRRRGSHRCRRCRGATLDRISEGRMIRLETLIELEFLSSSFSSSSFSIRAFRAYPLSEI